MLGNCTKSPRRPNNSMDLVPWTPIFMLISHHYKLLLPTDLPTSHYSVSVWCVLKWLDHGALSHGSSAGWLLIRLGLRGSGVSHLGWTGCAKWGFYLPWGSPTLMDPGKWIHEEEGQNRTRETAWATRQGRTVTVKWSVTDQSNVNHTPR